LFSGGLPTRRYEQFGQQKSPIMTRRATKRCASSHFPKLMMLELELHLSLNQSSIGCRGVIGQSSTTRYESVKSTDAID